MSLHEQRKYKVIVPEVPPADIELQDSFEEGETSDTESDESTSTDSDYIYSAGEESIYYTAQEPSSILSNASKMLAYKRNAFEYCLQILVDTSEDKTVYDVVNELLSLHVDSDGKAKTRKNLIRHLYTCFEECQATFKVQFSRKAAGQFVLEMLALFMQINYRVEETVFAFLRLRKLQLTVRLKFHHLASINSIVASIEQTVKRNYFLGLLFDRKECLKDASDQLGTGPPYFTVNLRGRGEKSKLETSNSIPILVDGLNLERHHFFQTWEGNARHAGLSSSSCNEPQDDDVEERHTDAQPVLGCQECWRVKREQQEQMTTTLIAVATSLKRKNLDELKSVIKDCRGR